MKKIAMAFGACMVFSYATAQLEPKTSQGTQDTISVPVTGAPADKTKIANKSLLKRNTLDAGTGKPDPVKKDIYSNEPVPTPVPLAKSRVEAVVDTITPKSRK